MCQQIIAETGFGTGKFGFAGGMAILCTKPLIYWLIEINFAAGDSSYNQNQDSLYNELSSWVVVRTM